MADDVRLIDANAIKSKMTAAVLGGHLQYWVCGEIDDAPTIDAQPVKHGRWVHPIENGDDYCSVCGSRYEGVFPTMFCPCCGAKMDGEADEG